MKTLRLFACGLTAACALSSCDYDAYPYGYRTVGYSSPRYVSADPMLFGRSYYHPGSPYVGSSYGYRTYYPRTYTSGRYLAPVTTRTYVSGYPLRRHMSVGGYGYLPPAPRPDPWPLR